MTIGRLLSYVNSLPVYNTGMKRLILMGGRPWLADDGGKRFVSTLFRYFPSGVKVAFCIFAQPESDWAATENTNKKMFNLFKGDRAVVYRTMNGENVTELSKWADVIYLPGGDPFVLQENLQSFDLAKMWDGKVIAGSSAGADLFCAGFASLSSRTFGQGLGWVQASIIPHWRADGFESFTDNDWDWAEVESLRQMPDLPLLCLSEGDFVEVTVR